MFLPMSQFMVKMEKAGFVIDSSEFVLVSTVEINFSNLLNRHLVK